MSATLIAQMDRIVAQASCPLSVEEIGDFIFGGLLGTADRVGLLADVVRAGIELNKNQGLPLAVPPPRDIGFFLIAWGGEWLSEDRAQEGEMGLGKLSRRMEKIERKHGAEDGPPPWRVGEGPTAWEAANSEFNRVSDQIFTDTLKQYGAHEIAALFAEDIDEFDRRREIGRLNFAKLTGREDLSEEMPDPN